MFLTDTYTQVLMMLQRKLWLCYSLSRLRRIQSLLSKQSDAERDQKSSASTAASESAAPDTLLCVLGICLELIYLIWS